MSLNDFAEFAKQLNAVEGYGNSTVFSTVCMNVEPYPNINGVRTLSKKHEFSTYRSFPNLRDDCRVSRRGGGGGGAGSGGGGGGGGCRGDDEGGGRGDDEGGCVGGDDEERGDDDDDEKGGDDEGGRRGTDGVVCVDDEKHTD